jgi:hypothetical protein
MQVGTLFASSPGSFPGQRWRVLGGSHSGAEEYATPRYDLLVYT